MSLTGQQHIGNAQEPGADSSSPLIATNAATGEKLAPGFAPASAGQIDRACRLAEAAAPAFAALPPAERARFLLTIAEELEARATEWTARAGQETALPPGRLAGEVARTTGQLRMHAEILQNGLYLDVRLDTALPDRKPLPRPPLAAMRVPVGPVAVFGASNFPLAFSVAGGDTASALAAGCPVVARAHPAHPGTAELAAQAILAAAERTAMPEGVFSLLTGLGNAIGEALVRHPSICAVGFTGSRAGGLALAAVAASRLRPIPVFAEMSSINPVFLLPGALAERAAAIGEGLAASVVLGVGQFCTNPGLVLGVAGPGWEAFVAAAAEAMRKAPAGTMLHAGIAAAYSQGVANLRATAGVTVLAEGGSEPGAQPLLASVDGARFLAEPALAQEIFGPFSLLVRCESVAQLMAIVESLEGQLTATVHFADVDIPLVRELLPKLTVLAGRVLANSFPTGVEVSTAMVHGGPFPATTDSRCSSVGAMALERWLRPVCWQGFPQELLPPALQTANPLGVPRRVDGAPPKP